MPGWNQVVEEVGKATAPIDSIRRKYLEEVHKVTGRNAVLYYTDFLGNASSEDDTSIRDADIGGFMTAFLGMDKNKDLDLFLHTPGGDVGATQAIIHYLLEMFEDIRVFVPQMAMSGGTMIACCAKEIVMARHSSLGPVDPQMVGEKGQISVLDVIKVFEQASKEIGDGSGGVASWWNTLQERYDPVDLERCLSAMDWAKDIVQNSLKRMFPEKLDEDKIKRIISQLTSEGVNNHSQRFSAEYCREKIGLKIKMLEDCQPLQEAVLSLHHACLLTFETTQAVKIIESHGGASWIKDFYPA